ncbi:MAG: class I SAM-dependent methyltransferase [Aeromicrobium sp.]
MRAEPRRQLILGLTDLEHGPGLEIAPLHKPVARKPEWDVTYVDIVSTEQLREHYAHDAEVPPEDIVDVDLPLTGPDGTIRSLADVAGPGAPYAWVIASHVIEHVPDLITWLEDLAALLRDNGALVLAIPDLRYSFDIHREQTTVGAMLQARAQRDLTPSVRAVYDHFSSASSITSTQAWAGTGPGRGSGRVHPRDEVDALVEQARSGEYVDSHVWTFRPSTFVEQINELGELGLCEFVVERVRSTRPNQLEFFAVLRRLPRDRTPEQDEALRAAGKHRTNDEPDRPIAPRAASITLSTRELQLIERKRALARKARRVLRRR